MFVTREGFKSVSSIGQLLYAYGYMESGVVRVGNKNLYLYYYDDYVDVVSYSTHMVRLYPDRELIKFLQGSLITPTTTAQLNGLFAGMDLSFSKEEFRCGHAWVPIRAGIVISSSGSIFKIPPDVRIEHKEVIRSTVQPSINLLRWANKCTQLITGFSGVSDFGQFYAQAECQKRDDQSYWGELLVRKQAGEVLTMDDFGKLAASSYRLPATFRAQHAAWCKDNAGHVVTDMTRSTYEPALHESVTWEEAIA